MNFDDNPDLIKAKTRYMEARADQAEFKLSVMRGEVVSVEKVNKAYAKTVQNIKNKLLGMPVKLAPKLTGLSAREIEAVMKAGITELLNELAGKSLVQS